MSAPHQTPLNGGYDQSLLAAAPEASRAARQEGYNVDLLDENLTSVKPPSRPRTNDGHEAARSKENYAALTPRSPVDDGRAVPRKVPFWRTRKGIITIAVLAIVIIGAVVGGAVGGSVSHNGGGGNSTSSDGSAQQATGGLPTNSTSSSGASAAGGTAPTETGSTSESGQPLGPPPSSTGQNADSSKQATATSTSFGGDAVPNIVLPTVSIIAGS